MPDISLHVITFDCEDPAVLAQFWAAVTGRDADPQRYDEIATIGMAASVRPFYLFQKVEVGPRGANRVHADLATSNFDHERSRLIGLGAQWIRDGAEHGIRFTTFSDPEGNKFDLIEPRR
jgi:Glyoxalase-like domain